MLPVSMFINFSYGNIVKNTARIYVSFKYFQCIHNLSEFYQYFDAAHTSRFVMNSTNKFVIISLRSLIVYILLCTLQYKINTIELNFEFIYFTTITIGILRFVWNNKIFSHLIKIYLNFECSISILLTTRRHPYMKNVRLNIPVVCSGVWYIMCLLVYR